MNIKAIGLDTAKSTFQLHGVDAADRAVLRKRLTRAKLLEFFAQLAPCLIGLEACGAAHHWARKLTALGHTVRLIPAQYVKAFVKRNKNDAADAEAICEALLRPNMRFVPVKQPWQQDIQSLHRIRSAAVAERTALSNQLRGLLAEYGLIAPKGLTKLRQTLPAILEDADNGLSGLMRTLIDQRREALERLDQLIAGYDRQVAQIAREHPDAERLITAPGIGPLTATALTRPGQRPAPLRQRPGARREPRAHPAPALHGQPTALAQYQQGRRRLCAHVAHPRRACRARECPQASPGSALRLGARSENAPRQEHRHRCRGQQTRTHRVGHTRSRMSLSQLRA